ncbi:hypothetical protein GQ457_12G009380 [Hibiscus cannabinus]
MECDGSVAARKLISYKDIVVGPNDSSHGSKSVAFDDDDIELLEDDIAFGSENGVPTIDFSERVQTLALQSMDLTLVVKVLGRRIGYNTLHNRIYGIWKPTHPLKLIDIENDFFLVKFSDRRDYLKVLTEGTWTILGHYLTVEQWSIDFQPTQASPSRLMAWIRLPGLPLTLYKHSFIEAIGSQVGSVIKIDFQRENGCHGRFACMAIVEYESLPTVCFHCGIYGHLKDICPKLHCSDEIPPAASEIPTSTPVPAHSVPDEAFGPWMLVERRKRNLRSVSSVIPAPKDPLPAVSVVNPIFDLPANEQEIVPETRDSVPTPIDSGNSYCSPSERHCSFSFKELVRLNWNSSLPISATIELFCHAADSWNRTVFGSLSHRKRHIMARLWGVQRRLDRGRNAFLSHLESSLQLELEQLLDQEELLWKQKSRSDWISFGDRNTAYFHKRATLNKRINRITKLQLASGEWCDDDAILHDEAVLFFRNLFANDGKVRGTFPLSGHFPDLSAEEMEGLDRVPSMEEIKDSLFAMSPLKSPGADGLHAHFFQQNWEIVDPSPIFL